MEVLGTVILVLFLGAVLLKLRALSLQPSSDSSQYPSHSWDGTKNSYDRQFDDSKSISKRVAEVEILSDRPIILVDDDFLIRMGWETRAQEADLEFEAFSSGEELLESMDRIPLDSSFFIDVELGEGMSGIKLAELLKAQGVERLWFATGYSQEGLKHIEVSGFVSKTPPF